MTPPNWLLRISGSLNVFLYKLSGGHLVARVNGMPVLLLTTRGRQTGRPHTVPVVYMRDGKDYVIAPGVVERPSWYLNLRTYPKATIQTGTFHAAVEARQAQAEERRRLWALVPAYWNAYQEKAKGELPLMVLNVQGEALPAE